MLKTILSISGKPGLYKLVSQGKNMLIVESLADKKRFPAYGNEKIISLGDIAMYTDTEDVPLKEVFLSMKKKENGAAVVLDLKKATAFLLRFCRRSFFKIRHTACHQQIIPNNQFLDVGRIYAVAIEGRQYLCQVSTQIVGSSLL